MHILEEAGQAFDFQRPPSPPPVSARWFLAPPTGFLCCLVCTPCFNLHMAGGGCSGRLSSAPTADWLTFSDRPPHPQSLPAGFLPRPQASFAAWFAPRASVCIWLVEAALASFLQLPLLIGRAFFFCPSFRAGSGLRWGRPCGAVGSTAPQGPAYVGCCPPACSF